MLNKFSRSRLMLALAVALAMTAVIVTPTSDAAQDASTGVPPARAIFDAGTDPAYAEDVLTELRTTPDGLELAQVGTHWNPIFTALNNGGGSQGDALELTWSIIPDGTFMPSQGNFDTACSSNLIATFNSVYGAGNWQDEIQAVWDDWTESTANVYTPAVALDGNGTPVDDGASWPNSPGIAGVRGDVRIGGCTIDGNSNVLAYNFFPSNGDMKIDAVDSFYANTSLALEFHNVISHEHGHGVGLSHVCPVNQTKLMEPFISSNFLGLQHDDIRGIQRGYGDRFELINNPNDTRPAASPISPLGGLTENTLSIDSPSDQDWFEFTASAGDLLDVTITPDGFTYLEGPDPVSDGCASASPTLLDSESLQNLRFNVRNSSGSIIESVNDNSAGFAESLTDLVIPASGTYFIQVRGSGIDDSQLYDLSVDLSEGTGSDPATIGNRVWDDLNGNGRQDSGEPGVGGVLVEILDGSGAVIDSRTTSGNGFWTRQIDPSVDNQIRVNAPAGSAFTIQDAGTNDTKDSDANSAGIIDIPAGTLASGDSDKSFDAGLTTGGGGPPATIGNRVWDDVNGNGRQNSGEPGVPGVLVEVLNTSGAVVASTTTNGNGFWTLSVDPDQAWQVRINSGNGPFTLQNVGNDNGDSDADGNGIIDIPVGTLAGGATNKSFDAGIALG